MTAVPTINGFRRQTVQQIIRNLNTSSDQLLYFTNALASGKVQGNNIPKLILAGHQTNVPAFVRAVYNGGLNVNTSIVKIIEHCADTGIPELLLTVLAHIQEIPDEYPVDIITYAIGECARPRLIELFDNLNVNQLCEIVPITTIIHELITRSKLSHTVDLMKHLAKNLPNAENYWSTIVSDEGLPVSEKMAIIELFKGCRTYDDRQTRISMLRHMSTSIGCAHLSAFFDGPPLPNRFANIAPEALVMTMTPMPPENRVEENTILTACPLDQIIPALRQFTHHRVDMFAIAFDRFPHAQYSHIVSLDICTPLMLLAVVAHIKPANIYPLYQCILTTNKFTKFIELAKRVITYYYKTESTMDVYHNIVTTQTTGTYDLVLAMANAVSDTAIPDMINTFNYVAVLPPDEAEFVSLKLVQLTRNVLPVMQALKTIHAITEPIMLHALGICDPPHCIQVLTTSDAFRTNRDVWHAIHTRTELTTDQHRSIADYFTEDFQSSDSDSGSDSGSDSDASMDSSSGTDSEEDEWEVVEGSGSSTSDEEMDQDSDGADEAVHNPSATGTSAARQALRHAQATGTVANRTDILAPLSPHARLTTIRDWRNITDNEWQIILPLISQRDYLQLWSLQSAEIRPTIFKQLLANAPRDDLLELYSRNAEEPDDETVEMVAQRLGEHDLANIREYGYNKAVSFLPPNIPDRPFFHEQLPPNASDRCLALADLHEELFNDPLFSQDTYVIFIGPTAYCATRNELKRLFAATDEWCYECVGSTSSRYPTMIDNTRFREHPDTTIYKPLVRVFTVWIPAEEVLAIINQHAGAYYIDTALTFTYTKVVDGIMFTPIKDMVSRRHCNSHETYHHIYTLDDVHFRTPDVHIRLPHRGILLV